MGISMQGMVVGWASPLSLTLSLKGEGTVGQMRMYRR
jgi:hypothetical protein